MKNARNRKAKLETYLGIINRPLNDDWPVLVRAAIRLEFDPLLDRISARLFAVYGPFLILQLHGDGGSMSTSR